MSAASVEFHGFVPAKTTAPAKPGLFARAIEAIHQAQTRRAEREIARFIERRGGRLTDELERRIERHFV
jgi:hypothetical protein